MRGLVWGLLLASAIANAAAPWTLSTSTSRTALWVGDRFEYVVRVEYREGLEFVGDHLKKEDLNLQPFEVIDASTSSGALAGGLHFFQLRLQLTTYAANAGEIAIPSITLFYFRQARSGAKEDVPADTLIVPAFKMAVRNTVVDASTGIRDRRAPLPIDRWTYWVLTALGIAGLAGVALYLALAGSRELRSRSWSRFQEQKDRGKRLKEAVRQVKQMPAGSEAELASFYDQASDVLRRLAAERLNQQRGFTPDELKVELERAGDSHAHAAALSDLLAICDEVRYAPGGMELGREKHREFLNRFDAL